MFRSRSSRVLFAGVALLGLVLLAVTVVTGVQWYLAKRSLGENTRNAERITALKEWQGWLAKNYRPGTYPAGDDLRQLQATPAPRAPEGSYPYAADTSGFAACAQLEGKEKRSFYITQHGSFASRSACTGAPPVTLSGALSQTGLQAEHNARLLTSHERVTFTSQEAVRAACKNVAGAHQILYGCYDPGTGAITVMNFPQRELAGERNVILVHEYLHYVYDQLAPERRAEVDTLLDKEYALPRNGNIREELEPYTAEDRHSELFARFGTEETALSAGLEAVYGEYFANRPKTVANHAGFRGIVDRLRSLKSNIDGYRQQMDQLRARGDIAGYNSLVDQHNSLVDQYNGLGRQFGFILN